MTIKYSNQNYKDAVIIDIYGNLIKKISRSENEILFKWDCKNSHGQKVSTGGYIFYIKGHKDIYCKIAVIN